MRRAALVAALSALLTTVAASEEGEPADRRVDLFPEGLLFALPIADPHRPGSAVNVAHYSSVGIDTATDRRFFLRLGGRFGLVRWRTGAARDRSWQLGLEAGMDGQFDMTHGQDNVGWDGNYGLSLSSTRAGSRWAFLFGVLHTSAHIGDEWIDRTGRERIN